MADWDAIKKEYISNDISLQKLADKYSVSITTLKKKCAKEKWSDLRHQKDTKKAKKMVSMVSNKEIKKASLIQSNTDGLLLYIQRCIEADVLNPDTACKFMRALKDAKDIKHDLTEYELREQDARIRALEKQSEEEKQEDRDINVNFVGMDDWFNKH